MGKSEKKNGPTKQKFGRENQMRISEGQTAVFAYPSAFSGGKSKGIIYKFKRIVPENFGKQGALGYVSTEHF